MDFLGVSITAMLLAPICASIIQFGSSYVTETTGTLHVAIPTSCLGTPLLLAQGCWLAASFALLFCHAAMLLALSVHSYRLYLYLYHYNPISILHIIPIPI